MVASAVARVRAQRSALPLPSCPSWTCGCEIANELVVLYGEVLFCTLIYTLSCRSHAGS